MTYARDARKKLWRRDRGAYLAEAFGVRSERLLAKLAPLAPAMPDLQERVLAAVTAQMVRAGRTFR